MKKKIINFFPSSLRERISPDRSSAEPGSASRGSDMLDRWTDREKWQGMMGMIEMANDLLYVDSMIHISAWDGVDVDNVVIPNGGTIRFINWTRLEKMVTFWASDAGQTFGKMEEEKMFMIWGHAPDPASVERILAFLLTLRIVAIAPGM